MGRMAIELDAFGAAMREAEKHRRVLRQRYGLTDRQIGSMVLARQPKSQSVFGAYEQAVFAAKKRMASNVRKLSGKECSHE